jgi:hypothetical protein
VDVVPFSILKQMSVSHCLWDPSYFKDELVGYFKDHPDEDPGQFQDGSRSNSPDGDEGNKRAKLDVMQG